MFENVWKQKIKKIKHGKRDEKNDKTTTITKRGEQNTKKNEFILDRTKCYAVWHRLQSWASSENAFLM